MSHLAAPYAPRRPQETVLYALVRDHLDEFLQVARETYDGPLPKYVRDEFRGYLSCGDFGRGFVHCACTSCDHALLVPFSCKCRGLCPSCAGRRMAASAAHLVDCVLPAKPMRQYVLSLPYELSALAATRPDVLRYLARAFWEALRSRYRAWATETGHANVETGAVTGVHRAGSSLNVHTHFHVLCIDGVYTENAAGELDFVAAAGPTPAELATLLMRLVVRVRRWLCRRGLLRDADESNAPPELSPIEQLTLAGTQRGQLVTTPGAAEPETKREAAPQRSGEAVTHERFNLHASVTLTAEDDVGRERLCRYLSRPAFSLGRLSLRRDGRVVYQVKKRGRGRVLVRVMTPVECLARLAAMVPPPRYPLLRLHGVLAARHTWRDRIVPTPRSPVRSRTATRDPENKPAERPRKAQGDREAVFAMPHIVQTAELTASGLAQRTTRGSALSVAHWARILDGELYAASARVDWATLLKRTFACDVAVCPMCGGKMRVRALLTEPASVAKVLGALRGDGARAPPADA